ncbi:MAG: hypothetical protein ABJ004_17880 [Cyclobacteriaceae bacterium]
MKRFIFLIAIPVLFACEETDDGPECPPNASCIEPIELSQPYLDSMRMAIIDLAVTSACSETETCHFIGFGSKPCGGPWEYLIYSSETDTAYLHALVTSYNDLDKQYNVESGKASDCAIAPAPDSVVCDGPGCVGYRQGVAYADGVCCN